LFIISQHEIQSFALSFDCFPTVNETEITVCFLCLRLRLRSIERAMDLTDSFTWEDLRTRDANTGQLTAAGWIPWINMFSMRAAIGIILFHIVQSTIRIVTNHETLFIVWYPFDWTLSPFYELVNISQVTHFKTEFSSTYSYSILNLTDCAYWNIPFSFVCLFVCFFLSFFLFVFLFCFLLILSWCSSTTERWSVGWQTRIGRNVQ